MTQSTRVLIVGAGPTGLTAAIELARRGIMPVVIEKRKTASNLSRAVGILPNSMDILTPSGAAKAIRKEAVIIQSSVFHNQDKQVSSIKMNGLRGLNKRLYALPQDRTEYHLLKVFRELGGKVNYGAEFLSLSQSDNEVSVSILGKAFRFDYVIGADGVNSTVREALRIPYEGFDLPETWSIADVDAKVWRNPRSFSIFLLKDGNVAVTVPLDKERFRVVATSKDALAALPIPMIVEKIRRSGTFKVSIRQAKTYQLGRAFLAGDAAHCHSPVGGRGMNLGIADAAELAECIANGTTKNYTAIRHPLGKKAIQMSERMRKAVTTTSFTKRFILMRLLKLFARVPSLRRRFVANTLDL
ncbi:NAD(P)/FAD-dependent oxidoreductase [Amylibacter sp. SFDW26]|uniref:FAD-dependent oxidoreductase n=1 Tax=Amylibacter sp. SFDW26 TaxID=2652722 RepID=UPI00186A767D|nr:FAD-dependent oxidoreductase [Amylibacter sp. SFDW26]